MLGCRARCKATRGCSIVVSMSRCGRDGPGSNPGIRREAPQPFPKPTSHEPIATPSQQHIALATTCTTTQRKTQHEQPTHSHTTRTYTPPRSDNVNEQLQLNQCNVGQQPMHVHVRVTTAGFELERPTPTLTRTAHADVTP